MSAFVKTHALGNDFLLMRQEDAGGHDYAELAKRICHRFFGVGGDGLILWTAETDRFKLRIFNQDGSEAECSGNGLRCLAAYLMRSGAWPKPAIRLETVSGVYELRRIAEEYEADMGMPELLPERIPFIASAGVSRIVDYPLRLAEETVSVTCCATGNPHCTLFVDAIDYEYVQRIGPQLETHAAFPNRTNVEFVHVRSRGEIEVAFWERGVGVTYASGTGSCGATVACILNGRTDRNVSVKTRAGRLQVEWPEGGRLKLTSTANIVAEGRYLEL
jgi:diaminopimelate epimerase